MASLNLVQIIGRIGKEPEIRYLPDGTATVTVNVATGEKYTDKDGKERDSTEWVRVAFFGRQAEVVGEYCHKGSQIYASGRMQTRKWTDKDGVERYTTEVRAFDIKLLGSRERSPGEDEQPKKESKREKDPSIEEDIPF